MTEIDADIHKPGERFQSWLKFLAGLAIFSAMFLFFSSGYSLPGIFGEVLRHNQANDIDASPLFYSEVENMSELEEGVAQLRLEARKRESIRDIRSATDQNLH